MTGSVKIDYDRLFDCDISEVIEYLEEIKLFYKDNAYVCLSEFWHDSSSHEIFIEYDN